MVQNPLSGRDPDVTVGIGGDASSLDSAIDTATSRLDDLKAAAGLAGGAIAALGAGAMAGAAQQAANFEEAMVEVEKVTDPETADQMAESIREMSGEMPLAQEELAGIAAQAGRFGIEGSNNIEQFTESVSRMAVATDLSTKQAGEAFARMTTLMDEEVSNVENVGSVVNELSNTMATSASEITNASTRSAGALSQLGLETDQILALNATMNEVSASSRIAGTRLRRFAQELANPGKTEELASALGITVEQFETMREESPNELMQQLVEQFEEGDDSADELRKTLSTTSRQALASLAQNTDGWADAQDAANQQLQAGTSLGEEYRAAVDTLTKEVQTLRNRVINVAIGIGNDLLPALSGAVGLFNDAFSSFEQLNNSFDQNIGTIALVSTTIAGLTVALVAFAPAMAAAAAATAAAATPVIALAGVIAALWIAWEENLLGIQDITEDVFGFVEDFIGDVGNTISSIWSAHADDIMKSGRNAFQNLRRIITRVVSAVRRLWNRFGDDILRIIRPVFDNLQVITKTTFENLLETIDLFLDLLSGNWKGVFDSLEQIVRNTLGAVIDIFQNFKKILVGNSIVPETVAAIQSNFSALRSWVENSWQFGSAVTSVVSGALSSARDEVDDFIESASSRLADLGGNGSVDLDTGNNTPGRNPNPPDNGGGGPGQQPGSRDPGLNDPGDDGGNGFVGLQTGGFIERAGAAILHEGERVVPEAQVSERGGLDIADGQIVDELAGLRTEQRRTRQAIRGLADEMDFTVDLPERGRYDPI